MSQEVDLISAVSFADDFHAAKHTVPRFSRSKDCSQERLAAYDMASCF